MNLSPLIDSARKLIGVKTRTPPWSVISFALMNELGAVGAWIDKATGALTIAGTPVSSTGISFLSSQGNQIAYAASGAISVASQTAVITKTSTLAAMTLALPTTAQNGVRIVITSTTALAHTITCPSAIINRGVTGDPVTVITLAAFPGGGVTLEAYAGKWQVIANELSTFA